MKKLTHIIEKRLNQHKLGDSARASHTLHLANNFLQDKLGATQSEVMAISLKEGVLTIGTISSVWSQELWAYQDELMEILNHQRGKKTVRKILITGLRNN